jgi:hypothetical protein
LFVWVVAETIIYSRGVDLQRYQPVNYQLIIDIEIQAGKLVSGQLKVGNKPGQPVQRHKSFTDSAVFAFIDYSCDNVIRFVCRFIL